MIGPHGAGGVSHTDPLHTAGVVGRHGLPLDDRHSFDAENFSGDGGAASQNPPQRGSGADFLDQFDGGLGVAELGNTGFHGHPNGGAHFDGIQAEIVVHSIQLGDDINVVDAAVAAMGPDSFILGLFGQVLAVFVKKRAGAANDAAPMAAVSGRPFAAAFFFQPRLGFPTDFFTVIEASPHEIFGWVRTGLINHVG